MKAIILARVSDKKQDSNEAQVMRISDYVKSKNLTIWKTYEIEESSTKGDRKKFNELIKDIQLSKEPIALIVDTVDRLQRSFRESVLLDDLRRAGKLEIHFYRESLVVHQNSNSADLLRWDMAVMFARSYVLQLSDNVKRKFEQKRRNGDWNGKPRIGYINTQEKNEKGEVIKRDIVIDPERAHLIERLFLLWTTGNYSRTTIWQEITRLGLRSLDGNVLSRSNVELILKDPFYYGMALSKKYGLYQHRYQPIISKELYERCQEVFRKRSKVKSQPLSEYFIFQGLLHCARCGCTMSPEKKKGKYIYYACTNAKHICTRIYVPEKDLLKPILSVFEAFASIPEEVEQRLTEELRINNESEVIYHKKELARIRVEYDRVQTRIDGLLNLLLDKSITKDEYDKKLQQFKDEQYRLDLEAEEHTKADHDFKLTLSRVFSISRRASNIFTRSEPQEKRALLNFLLQNPTVDGKKLDFTLRKPFNLVLELATNPNWLREQDSNLQPTPYINPLVS